MCQRAGTGRNLGSIVIMEIVDFVNVLQEMQWIKIYVVVKQYWSF